MNQVQWQRRDDKCDWNLKKAFRTMVHVDHDLYQFCYEFTICAYSKWMSSWVFGTWKVNDDCYFSINDGSIKANLVNNYIINAYLINDFSINASTINAYSIKKIDEHFEKNKICNLHY